MGLKFIQANLQHSRAASLIFTRTFDTDHIKVGLITEPYFAKGKIKNISGGQLFYSTSTQERPRACIYLEKDLNSFVMNEFCSKDVVTVRLNDIMVNGKSKSIIVCSAYFDSTVQEIPCELINLLDHCKTKNLDLILGVDSNAHHVLWGSKKTNNRGDFVTDFIAKNYLDIQNRGTQPTFVTSRCETIIDLTLTRAEVSEYVSNWRVTNFVSGSDHRHIQFELMEQYGDTRKYRNKFTTNWDTYIEELRKNLDSVQGNPCNLSELDTFASNLRKCLSGKERENKKRKYSMVESGFGETENCE